MFRLRCPHLASGWILAAACQSREVPPPDSGAASPPAAAQQVPPPSTSQAEQARTTAPPRASPDSGVAGALAVLRAYYAAVNAHDYARAYAAWGPSGPPGRPTLEAFAAGYQDTDSVQLELGPPGRLEGAAGSRYVSVPIELRAFTSGNPPTHYTGSYTVRRSVVPGADSASRRWHLYRATLEPAGQR